MSLQESDRLVIFGIMGDLARKMTLPALYHLERRGLLHVPVIVTARRDMTAEEIIAHTHDCVMAVEGAVDEDIFDRLSKRITYVRGDMDDEELYSDLATVLKGSVAPTFYLEVPPEWFVTVAQMLNKQGLTDGDARLIFEKPFGTSLQTATELNQQLHAFLREEQIFRIDHYLGKEPVQDIPYLRFGNAFFEPMWNSHYVDSIMVTMAENFGVEDRGAFYDKVGAIRDVVQNHLLQLTALTAIEPPTGDLTVPRQDLFRSIPDADPAHMVRGQYIGYQDIKGVAPGSTTETFVALRIEIDSWRWGGTPVLIRAGKNLPVKATEVVVRLKKIPKVYIGGRLRQIRGYDDIVLRLGSDPGVDLAIRVKSPGEDAVEPVNLRVDFKTALGEMPEPYEVLLSDAIAGNKALFPDERTIEETWRIVQPLLDDPVPPLPYEPGSWGPEAANEIAAPYGGWREPTA